MFDLNAQLAAFEPLRVLHLPTPFEAMPRLSTALGGPDLFVKRDDCTGLALGGNKTRKLQYVVAQALRAGVDTLITTGGIQSNHARQTAAFAARLGLSCELVLQGVLEHPPAGYAASGNVVLDRLLGATVHLPQAGLAADLAPDSGEAEMQALLAQAAARGRRASIVPLGASTPLGCLGYVECAQEILQQAAGLGRRVDAVVLATGSAGTQAGLLAGFRALAQRVRVIGMAVSGGDQQARRELVKALADETLALLGREETIGLDEVEVDGAYVGEAYGQFSREVVDALTRVARSEALILDPVYTGKAMQGLIDYCRRGAFGRGDQVVFLHSGGVPGAFAYSPWLIEHVMAAAG